MNDDLQQLHNQKSESLASRLNDAMQRLPALAAEKLETGTPPICPMLIFTEMAAHAVLWKLRETSTSTDTDSGSAGGVVCEGGGQIA